MMNRFNNGLAEMRGMNNAFESPDNRHEASMHLRNLIWCLKASGRTTDAGIREFPEDGISDLGRKLQDALLTLDSMTHREVKAAKVAPPPNEWRAPKTDWATVGSEPTPVTTNADQAFKELCTAVASLNDLGQVSEAAPRIMFDRSAYRVGISMITAAAQELAQFAMPDVTFDTGAKTMTQHVEAVASARDELRKDL